MRREPAKNLQNLTGIAVTRDSQLTDVAIRRGKIESGENRAALTNGKIYGDIDKPVESKRNYRSDARRK